jgi:hypothetical protein
VRELKERLGLETIFHKLHILMQALKNTSVVGNYLCMFPSYSKLTMYLYITFAHSEEKSIIKAELIW